MTRGRKKDLSIPVSRSLITQRAYRARKAAYVTDLEERLRKVEEDNQRLQAEVDVLRAQSASASGPAGVSGSVETVRAASDLMHCLTAAAHSLQHFQQIAFGSPSMDNSAAPPSGNHAPNASHSHAIPPFPHPAYVALRQPPPAMSSEPSRPAEQIPYGLPPFPLYPAGVPLQAGPLPGPPFMPRSFTDPPHPGAAAGDRRGPLRPWEDDRGRSPPEGGAGPSYVHAPMITPGYPFAPPGANPDSAVGSSRQADARTNEDEECCSGVVDCSELLDKERREAERTARGELHSGSDPESDDESHGGISGGLPETSEDGQQPRGSHSRSTSTHNGVQSPDTHSTLAMSKGWPAGRSILS